MVPTLRTLSNMEVAHTIHEYLKHSLPLGHTFMLRPYNFYQPDTTEWWFVPGSDWPAYHHSKLFVWRCPTYSVHPHELYMGYYVEHGLASHLSHLQGIQRKYVMHDGWYFKKFLHLAKKGGIDATIHGIALHCGEPVCILVKAYEFNRVPALNADPGAPYDSVEFSVDRRTGALEVQKRAMRILEGLNTCTKFNEIAKKLEAQRDFDFFWIDCLIGIIPGSGKKATGGSLVVEDICEKALLPWLSCIG